MSLDTGMKKNRRRRSALLMDTLGDVYAFIYCMMISSALTDMPLLGGALYMCGRVTMVFISTFSNPFVPVMARKLRGVLLGVMLLARFIAENKQLKDDNRRLKEDNDLFI